MEWRGIAIIGIWLGVGFAAFGAKEWTGIVAFFALLATMIVVGIRY